MKNFILLFISHSIISLCVAQSNKAISLQSTFSQSALTKKDTANPNSIPDLKPSFFVDFVGSGDIQKSLSQGQEIQANTGVGVDIERFLGKSKFIQSYEIESRINIASTSDTIKAVVKDGEVQNIRDFGTYLLNPTSVKQALFINANVYFGQTIRQSGKRQGKEARFPKVISGINFRSNVSNNVWQYEDSACDLGVLALRTGVFHEFIPFANRLTDQGRSKFSLILGANFSFRRIFGDITTVQKDYFRTKILNNPQKSFYGWEWTFGFRLDNLIAEFQAPVFDTKYTSIPGFNNTQFVFTIRFIGGFGLKLNDNSSKPASGDNTSQP